ncbi:MAG: glutamine cyclotransferase, partial [Tannerella sp.]|nr:glutamine cyclotransferase [Tannerella sp.]
MIFKLCYLALSLLLLCCSQKPTQKTVPPPPPLVVNSPDFNADSAYSYVAQQVAFGPRVPNSDAHKACAKWLA